MSTGKLWGMGHYVERKGFTRLEADIDASDLQNLRGLVNGARMQTFSPQWSWFRRAAKELEKGPHSDGRADWAYTLAVMWENKRAAFHIMPDDMRKYLTEDAKETYKQMDAILGYMLELPRKYASTSKLTEADKRAIEQMHLQSHEVAKRSLPQW